TRNGENQICPHVTQADDAAVELRLVGGRATLEGHNLTAAATAAGVSVQWLDFASEEAQAAIADQGPGAVRLPLVIVDGTYTLRRRCSPAVSACRAALRSGNSPLPVGGRLVGDGVS